MATGNFSQGKYYKKPSTANAKPATTAPIQTIGQWTPGALSNLPTTQGVTTSQANKITTNFTDLGGGKTGSLINQPITDLNQQTAVFAEKAQQALSQQLPQGVPAQVPNPAGALPFAPNTNNPFAPNFSGTPPPTGFEQAAGAEGAEHNRLVNAGLIPPNSGQGAGTFSAENIMGAATMLSAGGAEVGFGIVSQAISYITGLGGGSWLAGIQSLIPFGTRGGLNMEVLTGMRTAVNKAPGELSEIGKQLLMMKPGKIATATEKATEKVAAIGGVKASSTIKTMVAKWFTQDKLVAYADAAGRRRWKTVQVNTLAQAAKNPWTYLKAVGVAGGVATFVSYLVMNGKQSQATGTRDVKEELKGYLVTQARDMFRDGDYERGNLFLQMAKDSTNQTISALPGGKGSMQGSNIFSDVVNETIPILTEHYAEMEQMEATGNTPETNANFWLDYHAQIEANKTAEEAARVDYYNSERLRVEQEIAAARAKSNSSERAADRKAAADLAAFWLDYQKKLAALEEEEMKKQAEYWLNYRKMVIKIQEESGRSRLGFGLFR